MLLDSSSQRRFLWIWGGNINNDFCFHIFIHHKMRKECFVLFTPSHMLASDSYYSLRTISRQSDLYILTRVTVAYMVNQIIGFWALRFIHQNQFVWLHESILCLSKIPAGSYHVTSKDRPAFGSLFSVIYLFHTLCCPLLYFLLLS